MNKKRVVMVLSHDAIYPSIDVRVIKEAKTLLNMGFQVSIVCRMSKEVWDYQENFEGIDIIRVLCPHPALETNRIIRLLYNFKNVKRITEKIIELKPDIIHCHDLNALLEGVLAKRRLKVPLIYDSHEAWPLLEYSKNSNSRLVYFFTAFYERFLLNHVTFEIRAVAHQQRLLPEDRSILLLNCPMIDFMDNADPESILNKYDLYDKIVITYHGVVGEKKGIVDMIDSAEKLIKKYDNLKFLVVGHGYEPFLEMVKKRNLDKHFIFTGRVKYKYMPSFLKASDIGFTIHRPIRQYLIGTPNKLYEGMAAGLAILGNAEFPGINEVITDNDTGVTVNCDVDEIVTGLEKLINNEKLRKKYGKNARTAMEREFNWEIQQKRLIALYKKALF